MPALPDVPNVLKVVLEYQLGADLTAINRVYWEYSGTPPTDGVCVTIATDVSNAWNTDVASLVTSENSLESVTVTDLSSATSGEGSYIATRQGTRGGAQLPANVALLENLLIGRRYRGGKPRTYWPLGVAADVLNSQQWTTAFLSGVAGNLASFATAVSAISVSGCLLSPGQVNISYYEGFTSVLNPVTGRTRDVPKVRSSALIDSIASRSVNPYIASQRRRTLIRHH